MNRIGLAYVQSVAQPESNLETAKPPLLVANTNAKLSTKRATTSGSTHTQSIKKITASTATSNQSISVNLTLTTLTGIDGTMTLLTCRLSVLTAIGLKHTYQVTVIQVSGKNKKKPPPRISPEQGLLPRAYGLLRPTTKLFALWVKPL